MKSARGFDVGRMNQSLFDVNWSVEQIINSWETSNLPVKYSKQKFLPFSSVNIQHFGFDPSRLKRWWNRGELHQACLMVYIYRMFTTMGPAFARQSANREEGAGERFAQRDREMYHCDSNCLYTCAVKWSYSFRECVLQDYCNEWVLLGLN